MLVSSTWALPSRNFDVPCDFNTFASTSWTQNLTYSKERHEKERLGGWKKKNYYRCEQGSNLRGKIPLDFKSNALTTRPSQHAAMQGGNVYI